LADILGVTIGCLRADARVAQHIEVLQDAARVRPGRSHHFVRPDLAFGAAVLRVVTPHEGLP
jgi:hypothetical protein